MRIENGYMPHTYQHQRIQGKSNFLDLLSIANNADSCKTHASDKLFELSELFEPGNEKIAEQLYTQITGKSINPHFYGSLS